MSMSMSISSSSMANISQDLFSKLDTKKQGYIDKSELQQAFSSISGSSDSSNTDQLFAKLDGNSDGKITQAELSSGMQSLGEALQSQLKQSQASGAGMPMGPPPGMDDGGGMTKDQITSTANDSSTNSTAKAKLTSLAQNFEAADTNHDGKVSAKEAMTFDQSQSTNSTDSASSGSKSSSAVDDQMKLMAQLMQLIQAYGGDAGGSSSSATSTVSATA